MTSKQVAYVVSLPPYLCDSFPSEYVSPVHFFWKINYK